MEFYRLCFGILGLLRIGRINRTDIGIVANRTDKSDGYESSYCLRTGTDMMVRTT